MNRVFTGNKIHDADCLMGRSMRKLDFSVYIAECIDVFNTRLEVFVDLKKFSVHFELNICCFR